MRGNDARFCVRTPEGILIGTGSVWTRAAALNQSEPLPPDGLKLQPYEKTARSNDLMAKMLDRRSLSLLVD
jgi:hypothetical protein